jgi:hypothetical protein
MSQESDLKALSAQAEQAYQQGRPTFVARLKLGAWGTGVGQLTAWMDSVDAVEQAGWVLDRWTTTADPGGTFNAFPLFRRREPWTPQDRT